MNHLYIDIETVPAFSREVVADLIAHRQDKDPDRYAATCPWLCDIVCVGTALNDDEPMVLESTQSLLTYLACLFEGLRDPIQLVTFNGREFDVPVIVHRSSRLRAAGDGTVPATPPLRADEAVAREPAPWSVEDGPLVVTVTATSKAQAGPLRWLKSLATEKPWTLPADRMHLDLLDVMRQGTRRPCSFREACIAYGVGDPKAECDGSQVQDLVARGDIDAVHRYCRSDVVFLRKLHKAMRGLLS